MVTISSEDNQKISARAILMGLYFMSLPLGVVELPIGGSLLRYVALIPVAVTLIYLLNPVNEFKLLIEHFAFIVLFFAILLSAQFSVNKSASYGGILTGLTLIGLFVISTGVPYNKKEVNWLIEASLWASRITAVLTLLFGNDIGNNRVSLSNSLFVEDANYLIGYFMIGIAFCLHRFLSADHEPGKRFLAVLEFGVYMYTLLLTGSRGGAIGVLICLAAYLIMRGIYYREVVKMLGIFLVLMVLFIMVIIIGLLFIPLEVVQRFTLSAVLESGGTGRFELWRYSYYIFRDSPLWRQIIGYGSNTVMDIQVGDYFLWNVVHNFWFEKLLELGVIGLISYVFIAGTCLKRLLQEKMMVFFAAYLGIIGLSMSLSLRAYKPWWHLMILIYIVSEHYKKTEDS